MSLSPTSRLLTFGLTLTFLRVILFEPVILLFVSIKESTVQQILLSKSFSKLFSFSKVIFMYMNAFSNYSFTMSLGNLSSYIN